MRNILGYSLLIAVAFLFSYCGDGKKKEPVPTYQALNESDFQWRQEVVSVIDVRDEGNEAFATTQGDDKSLIDVILDAALNDSSLTIYDVIFGTDVPLTVAELNTKMGVTMDTSWVPESQPPYELEPIITIDTFMRSNVVKYYIKENWYYTADGNVAEKRTFAIIAVTEVFDMEDNFMGNKPLCYIDLMEASELLWNANVAGLEKDGKPVSFIEAFLERKYNSKLKQGHPKVNNKVSLVANEARKDDEKIAAEVKWVQDVWSEIDLSDSINEDFAHPQYMDPCRKSLVMVLVDEIKSNDEVKAYNFLDQGALEEELSSEEFNDITGTTTDTIWIPSHEPPYDLLAAVAIEEWDGSYVEKFRIKERWYFNEKKEVVEKRIVAICPVQGEYDFEGNFKGHRPLFWVSFEKMKPSFANAYIFNTMVFWENADMEAINTIEPRTYQEVFYGREFKAVRMDRKSYQSPMVPYASKEEKANV